MTELRAPHNIGEVLNKLAHAHKVSGGWQADCPCPGHDTPQKHLSIKDAGDKSLVMCFGSHTYEDICQALGYDSLTYTPTKVTPVGGKSPKIVATYDYLDEHEQLLYQVVRYDPKDFRQRHKNGNGEWVWNLDGCRRVLYHLDRLQKVKGETVIVVEGEKDCDNLWNCGYISTTSPQGANAWRPEYADFLKDKYVCIIPDKDPPGFAYARQVARSLQGKAKSVKAIVLPGTAKDFTDWLDAGADHTTLPSLEQDVSILFDTRPKYERQDDDIVWRKEWVEFRAAKLKDERTGVHALVTVSTTDAPLQWSYLNIEKREDRSALATAAHGSLREEVGKVYAKDDLRRDLDAFCHGLWDYKLSQDVPESMGGEEMLTPLEFLVKPYLLRAGGTILYAPPGRGKSYMALLWSISVDAGCSKFWPCRQVPVLFINLERSRQSLRRRLALVNRVLGMAVDRPLLTLNARGKTLADVLAVCRRTVAERHVGMVVLDSISRAGVGDLTENLSGNRVIDALSSLCPSWLALGHTPRQSEGHLYGSIMQDAGADICVQLNSQTLEDLTLGVGLEVTKQNDTGSFTQAIWAMEFDAELGLKGFREAKPYEFPEIEGKGRQSMHDAIVDFILEQEGADATASMIAEATGFNRVNVSAYLNKSGKFRQTRRVKTSVYYGLL